MAQSGAWAEFIIAILTVPVTLFATDWVRRNAVRLGLAQEANDRSSHTGTKPTGGGVGMVLALVLSGLFVMLTGTIGLWSVLLIGLLLAAVGLDDDRTDLRVSVRLAGQLLAILALLILSPGFVNALAPLPYIAAGVALLLAGALWINLFNFMDGIDGLAAGQTAFLGLGLLILTHSQADPGLWFWTGCLVIAAISFLFLNWAPSRIFMGDGGAYFLSFILFALAVAAVAREEMPLASGIILPGLFLADAGVTLVRRLLTGHGLAEAHRTHAYQHLSRRLGHALTVLTYMAINLVWLLPMALIVAAGAINPWVGLVLAYLPLLVFVILAKAGRPEHAH